MKRFSVRIQVRLGSGKLLDRRVNIGAKSAGEANQIALAVVAVLDRRGRVVSEDRTAGRSEVGEEVSLENAILWALTTEVE